jgi:hypothetical protein
LAFYRSLSNVVNQKVDLEAGAVAELESGWRVNPPRSSACKRANATVSLDWHNPAATGCRLPRPMTLPTRSQLLGCFVLLAVVICLLLARYLRVLWWSR